MLEAILNEYCYAEEDINDAIEQDQLRLTGNDGIVRSIFEEDAVEMTKWPAILEVWVDVEKLEACRGNQTTLTPVSSAVRTSAIWALAVVAIFNSK